MIQLRSHFTLKLTITFILVISLNASDGFYKDLFMDGGVGLNSRITLPAAISLGLEYEYLADEDTTVNKIIMVSNLEDDNGFLLYPDGSPRFKVIFTNGGNADIHGLALGEVGKERIRSFYYNGGSYTGSCAGAILSTMNTNTWLDPKDNTNYYNIWPGRSHFTQLADSYVDLKIPNSSPLWQYEDFGEDSTVKQVLHNGGVFVIEDDNYYWAPDTELLSTYDSSILGNDSEFIDFYNHGSSWAYKENEQSGRIVVTGSHPESVDWGDQLNLMKAILQYALDGIGKPSIKGVLTKGSERYMNDNNSKGYEKIGDKQIHHFTIDIKKDEPALSFHLNGADGYKFNIFINKDNFAYSDNALYIDTTNSSDKTIFLENVGSGIWYIAIECDTTIIAKKHSWGYTYEGDMNLMNGIEYSLLIDNQTNINNIDFKFNESSPSIHFNNNTKMIEIIGPIKSGFKMTLFDIRGRNVWEYNGKNKTTNQKDVLINKRIGSGRFILKYKDKNNELIKKLIIK